MCLASPLSHTLASHLRHPAFVIIRLSGPQVGDASGPRPLRCLRGSSYQRLLCKYAGAQELPLKESSAAYRELIIHDTCKNDDTQFVAET